MSAISAQPMARLLRREPKYERGKGTVQHPRIVCTSDLTHRLKALHDGLWARALLHMFNNKVEQLADLEIPENTNELFADRGEHLLLEYPLRETSQRGVDAKPIIHSLASSPPILA